MTYLQNPDVDQSTQIESSNPFENGGGTALLTPDSDEDGQTDTTEQWSDYSPDSLFLSPISASGDDLDNDEAYFLEDEDDDDEDVEDDYDDDDDDDDGDDQSAADSDEEDDDEEL